MNALINFFDIYIGELNRIAMMLKCDGTFLRDPRQVRISKNLFPVEFYIECLVDQCDLKAVPLTGPVVGIYQRSDTAPDFGWHAGVFPVAVNFT